MTATDQGPGDLYALTAPQRRAPVEDTADPDWHRHYAFLGPSEGHRHVGGKSPHRHQRQVAWGPPLTSPPPEPAAEAATPSPDAGMIARGRKQAADLLRGEARRLDQIQGGFADEVRDRRRRAAEFRAAADLIEQEQ